MSNLYSRLYLQKKSSKLVFFLVFALGLWGMILGSLFFLRKDFVKATDQQIKFMTIVNLSASQIGVVWQTQEAGESYIIYGSDIQALSEVAKDLYADKAGKVRKFHYAELRNLKPKTKYYFLIWDGKRFIGRSKNTPFSFQTPDYYLPAKTSPLIARLIEGSQPVANRLLFLQIEGFMPLATLTEEDGSFIFPMGLVFGNKNMERKTPSGKERFELRLLGDEDRIIAKGILQGFWDYTGILEVEKEYDFFNVDTSRKPRSIVVSEEEEIGKENEILLIYPRQNAVISELNPLIRGRGVPQRDVVVEMRGPKIIVYKTAVDERGDWWADIVDPLPPGDYELVVRTTDEGEKEVVMTRNFSITKSGESVLADATPEADLTPTPTEVIDPTPTLSPPTPTPTRALAEPDQETTPTPPVSGFDFNILGISAVVALISAGVLSLLRLRL